ncbi:MAG: hypothetical protein Q8L60_13725, partial [Gammaproteobacteria bacterium]|nr:hypothetical protein [Gammaproteobacteria bacterium]MDP2348832.1 hypothetical protein [Gammaproteobacteria bacterium]
LERSGGHGGQMLAIDAGEDPWMSAVLIMAGIINGENNRSMLGEHLLEEFSEWFKVILALNVADETAQRSWRRLTEGEKLLASSNGLNIVNIDRVQVHNRGYFGIEREVIAPNGDIYIGLNNEQGVPWSEDYSVETLRVQSQFLHELVHVYQSRTVGCGRICMAENRRKNPNYDYVIEPNKSFSSYGNEEQAAMVQDRFLLRNGANHYRRNSSTLEQLNGVIPF